MKYLKNMKKAAFAVLLIPLIALTAPVLAESPFEAIRANNDANNVSSNMSINRTIIDPMDPGYIWGNPNAIDLTGANPTIFESNTFNKVPGGLMSDMYTTSINSFRRSDPKAGVSNVTRKAAKVGLVNWP
jgi:hypothetical protein